MSWSDPIADMLVRIRNAHMAELEIVEMPHSQMKSEIAKVLKKEGYVTDFTVEGGVKKTLRVYLKYTQEHEPAILGLKRVSKAGRRRYVASDSIPKVLNGLGVTVMSTSAGIMTGKEARGKNIGGEVVCSVW
ncbi:MAG: 30S ribosomal protein S8 [Kiritimatiellae bacterium]|nr:30S ribosomal protein S8 [Kiritimatiellia bacterium]